MIKARGPSKERVINDPRFKRTRENMEEFTRAANAGKLLRNGLSHPIAMASDNRMANRLLGVMMQVVKQDQTSVRGKRNVLDGELSLLEGFEFNANATLQHTFNSGYTASINRATGICSLEVPSFNIEKSMIKVAGATHFRFLVSATIIDFESGVIEKKVKEAVSLPLMPATTQPIFLAFSIEFAQQANGHMYNLNNGLFNSCSIVKIDA